MSGSHICRWRLVRSQARPSLDLCTSCFIMLQLLLVACREGWLGPLLFLQVCLNATMLATGALGTQSCGSCPNDMSLAWSNLGSFCWWLSDPHLSSTSPRITVRHQLFEPRQQVLVAVVCLRRTCSVVNSATLPLGTYRTQDIQDTNKLTNLF